MTPLKDIIHVIIRLGENQGYVAECREISVSSAAKLTIAILNELC